MPPSHIINRATSPLAKRYGFLLLTYGRSSPVISSSSILSNVGSYLRTINSRISKTLYISLESNQRIRTCVNNSNNIEQELEQDFSSPSSSSSSSSGSPSISDLIRIVPQIYAAAHRYAPRVDVRVLHHAHYHRSAIASNIKRKLCFSPEIVYITENLPKENVCNYLRANFDISPPDQDSMVELKAADDDPELEQTQTNDTKAEVSSSVYDHVCLGGTFDNLHNGHKIMLSTGQLKCGRSLTIGVTDRNMVRNKTLWELIESPEKRIETLGAYLLDTDPYIEYRIVPIQDPFGPAIVDERLQAIVVSDETIRGGEKINEIRLSKSMPTLQIETIRLLADGHREHRDIEEDKVSSSSLRIRKLGAMLREPSVRENLPARPYLIGLTGMIASGKSSIADKLRQLGAGVINVDLLAHHAYRDETMPAFREIVQTFGAQILDAGGRQIDRRKLGEIVFGDPQKLAQLNAIIWPKMRQLISDEIDALKVNHSVIVLEMALLIEANRMRNVHQIWLTILNDQEAIRRLCARNNLTEGEALKRVRSLAPAQDKIPHANVVFCTQWDESVTWQQVKRAWEMLQEYIGERPVTPTKSTKSED